MKFIETFEYFLYKDNDIQILDDIENEFNDELTKLDEVKKVVLIRPDSSKTENVVFIKILLNESDTIEKNSHLIFEISIYKNNLTVRPVASSIKNTSVGFYEYKKFVTTDRYDIKSAVKSIKDFLVYYLKK